MFLGLRVFDLGFLSLGLIFLGLDLGFGFGVCFFKIFRVDGVYFSFLKLNLFSVPLIRRKILE